MATVKIHKKVPMQSVVTFIGPGSGTLDLADIAADFQTFDRGNCNVSINTALFTVSDTATISRGGTNVLVLTAGQDTLRFASELGCVIDTNDSANIVVNFGSGTGTISLGLSKTAGYELDTTTAIGYDLNQNFRSGN